MGAVTAKCKVCGQPALHGSFCSKRCYGISVQEKLTAGKGEPDLPPLNTDNIAMEGYIALVQAIVKKARSDFLLFPAGSYDRNKVEQFFLSDYFEVLTGLNGEEILKDLRKEYEERKRRKGKRRGSE